MLRALCMVAFLVGALTSQGCVVTTTSTGCPAGDIDCGTGWCCDSQHPVCLTGTNQCAATSVCNAGDGVTEANCGGDTCSCAASCTLDSDCNSGCCDGAYCAPTCVCNGQGTTTVCG